MLQNLNVHARLKVYVYCAVVSAVIRGSMWTICCKKVVDWILNSDWNYKRLWYSDWTPI